MFTYTDQNIPQVNRLTVLEASSFRFHNALTSIAQSLEKLVTIQQSLERTVARVEETQRQQANQINYLFSTLGTIDTKLDRILAKIGA